MRIIRGVMAGLFLSLAIQLAAFADDTKLDSLTTTDGKTYTNITIKRSDPSGIDIVYSAGAVHLLFANLPKEIQDKYGYDPAKAQAFLAQKAVESQNANAELQNQLIDQENQQLLMKSAFRIYGKVDQFTPDGSLCHCSVVNYVTVTRTAYVSDNDPIALAKQRIQVEVKETVPQVSSFQEMVWVTGLPNSLVDGDTWNDLAWPIGNYSYTTVMGGTAKVRAFTTDPVTALKFIQSQGE